MSPLPTIRIGDRLVGPDRPAFVIAEAGVNHNGDVGLARDLVDAALEAGVDAVKLQAFSASALATASAPKFGYARRESAPDETLRAMLARLELAEDDLGEVAEHCRSRGIRLLVTPFDERMVDFVASLGVPAMKVGSSDNDNAPVLRRIGATGLPVILSTGMCTLADVGRAVATLQAAGADQIALLQCTTSYPAPFDQVNLRAIRSMASAFGLPVGLSDHTTGTHVAAAAIALGACIIEKHFTLDRRLPGPDQQASLEPHELRAMVEQIRDVEAALGDGVKRILRAEDAVAPQARRFVVAARALDEGHVVRAGDICLKRAGGGIPAPHYDLVLGMRLARSVAPDCPIKWADFGVERCDG
jgi:N,N'-diacetyllegionaminate synthase